MPHQQMKEAFVSNLNGTSLLEISVGLFLAPSCLLSRGLLLAFYFLRSKEALRSPSGRFLLDFAVLVVPLVLSCTILSPVLFWVVVSILASSGGLVAFMYSKRTGYAKAPLTHILRDFSRTTLETASLPPVTKFRVFVNVLTSVSILAVDFPQYPRRYAKTETYGTGVMDFGVGSFVFGNALVCPEVRVKPDAGRNKGAHLAKQVFSLWPLLVLGCGRLASVKATEYHEHVSEYGVHWNFFYTLAAVRMAASLLLTLVPAQKAWMVAVTLAAAYECLLGRLSLKAFILHGSDRDGFFNANREGIFSLLGYLAIYMASVQVGVYLSKKRTAVEDWLKVIRCFLLLVPFLFVCLHISQTYVDAVSRRMANLSFCIWVVAHCLSLFSYFLATDLLLVFVNLLVDGADIPSSWGFVPPSSKKQDSEPRERKPGRHAGCLIGAVNKNQLLYFLLANVLTGLVNMTVDTIHSGSLSAMLILHLYMFVNCSIMYILHANNVVLKCW